MRREESTTLGVYRGKVVSWKGAYGWIRPDDGSPDVFVHYSAIDTQMEYRQLNHGQRVEFELVHGPKGAMAGRVKVVSA